MFCSNEANQASLNRSTGGNPGVPRTQIFHASFWCCDSSAPRAFVPAGARAAMSSAVYVPSGSVVTTGPATDSSSYLVLNGVCQFNTDEFQISQDGLPRTSCDTLKKTRGYNIAKLSRAIPVIPVDTSTTAPSEAAQQREQNVPLTPLHSTTPTSNSPLNMDDLHDEPCSSVHSIPPADVSQDSNIDEHDAPEPMQAQSTTNTHHMVTRSKHFFKPKLYSLTSDITPNSVHDALSHPDWSPAVLAEFKALQDNKTWELVDLPPGKKAIGCKWLFRVKRNADGTISKYKAHLVAKGFTQIPGFDFLETFSPVVRFFTVNILLSVAVTNQWKVHQVDVNNGIWFSPQNTDSFLLSAFSDADWGSDIDDRRSTTGYCILLGQHLISWCAKKQRAVSRSTAEAEYRSLADATAEVTWIQSVLSDMQISLKDTPKLWCDNTSTISMASNPVLHAKTKHVDLDLHFVREKVADGSIQVNYVPASNQLADIFTKPVAAQHFQFIRQELRILEPKKNKAGKMLNEEQCNSCKAGITNE
ncbi:hypothetical protein GQ457_14G008390 [Hibiscus cannabinus]